MINPLTIHILVKNNESTIKKTLDSIIDLKAEIFVGDLGCTDKTIRICNDYTKNIKRFSLNDNISNVRNDMLNLSKTLWNFYLEPWEYILSGVDVIKNSIFEKSGAYKVNILQNDLLLKSTRIWHKNTGFIFKDPVYESLNGEGADSSIYLKSLPHDNNYSELLKTWRTKSPLAVEPLYYLSCNYLQEKNWDSFLNYSLMYLHQEKIQKKSFFLTHYYRAMVLCYIKKDFANAIRSLMICIANKPTSAEFWCLLGDVYYSMQKYDLAREFYENGMLLGSRRLKEDDYPLEISKYKDYPKKMIASCNQIMQALQSYSNSPLPNA